MYVVIDTPVMKDLMKNTSTINVFMNNIGAPTLVIVITYSLEKQYRNIIGVTANDIKRVFRSIGYRIKISTLSRDFEEYVLNGYRDLMVLVEKAISTIDIWVRMML